MDILESMDSFPLPQKNARVCLSPEEVKKLNPKKIEAISDRPALDPIRLAWYHLVQVTCLPPTSIEPQ